MSLRRQTLWSMLPILVTSVVSIVSVPLYFRYLGEEMYAIWFYVGTLTGAFGFMDFGLGVAVGRFIGVALGRNDQSAVQEYWATGHAIVLPFVLVFAFLFIVIGTIWGPTWFKVSEANVPLLRWAMLWGGVGLFFAYYGQMWNILAQSFLDFRYLSVLRTGTSLAASVGSVAIAVFSRSVPAIVLFNTALGMLSFVLLYRRAIKSYQLPIHFQFFRWERLKEMLPYSLKTFGQLISGSVLGSLDRVFLGRLAPASDFAAFNVSLNIGSRLSGLSVAIMGPIFNNTTRGVGGDASRHPAQVYRESFNFMFPWYSLAIIGVFFWSGPITDLWLGEKYGSLVGHTFPWVVTALCVNAMANISTAQLGSLNRVEVSLVTQIVVSISSAIGVWIGWKINGLSGASIGFTFARVFWVLQDCYVRKIIGVSFTEYRSALFVVIRQAGLNGTIYAISLLFWPDSRMIAFAGIAAACVSVATEVIFEAKNKYRDNMI
jgi:O-antigen/teichoic acid export membrane protein